MRYQARGIANTPEPPRSTGEPFRQLLASMRGADLYDVRGKRVGAFIELLGDGDRVAIRQDGVLVWRRRVLPVVAVGAVLPKHGSHGAVALNVDQKTLNDLVETRTAPEGHSVSGNDQEPEEELETRLAPYVSARDADKPVLSPSRREPETAVERHLLFVATPRGYHLIERDGPAPAACDFVSLPDYESAFRVMKLASSPLPQDRRTCAYLEQS
jgi:hypothetical protein